MTTGGVLPEPQHADAPTVSGAGFSGWPAPRSMSDHIAEIARALSVRKIGRETVPVEQAMGRVLAEDLRAPFDLPPFDNSQMDGFALLAARTPGEFAVGGMIAAGHPRGGAEPGGEADPVTPASAASSPAPPALPRAVPIMTGAPVPPEADAVVPVEETAGFDAATISIAATEAGRFVRPGGSDITAGEVAVAAGTSLHPAALGVFSAFGLTQVRVRRRPRVLVVTGGDEVAAPGGELRPGQIYDANATLLRTVLEGSGAQVVAALTVDDTVDDFRTALAREIHAVSPDLVVTSGGISAGKFEVVRLALAPGSRVDERIAAQVGFGSVAMQPGGPQGVGLLHVGDAEAAGEERAEAVPVVCFPGNPVSTWTSAHLLLREALASAWGVGSPAQRMRAVLVEDVAPLGSKTQIRRARLAQGLRADGTVDPRSAELRVQAFAGTSSHLLATAARANAFLVVPAGRETVSAGEILEAVVLDGF